MKKYLMVQSENLIGLLDLVNSKMDAGSLHSGGVVFEISDDIARI